MIRKHFAGFAASALALAVSAQAFAGTVTTDGADIVINTKSGLEVATVDKQFSFKLGGKLQWDANQFDGLRAAAEDSPFDSTFNTYIRRAELSIEGTAYKNWGYGFTLEHDGPDDNATEFTDAYFSYEGFDLASVTIGRFGVDYGLENTTSSSWITGIERPFMYDYLNGDEDTNFGVAVKHSGDNYGLLAQVATYKSEYNDGDEENDESFGYSLRANWAPYLNGTDVIHLGANYHSNNPDDDRARVRTRLGLRSDGDDRLTFTDTRVTDKDTEWLLEAGAQFGGLRAQAEYFSRSISGESAGGAAQDVDVDGYYAQVGYMFGGVRGFKAADGKWDKPTEAGAIEVFARYENSTIDGDAAAVSGNIIAGVALDEWSMTSSKPAPWSSASTTSRPRRYA